MNQMEHRTGVAQRFLATATAWAATRPDLVGLALVGSYARDAARPDSDIDLLLLTIDARRYLAETSWTLAFSAIARQQIENWGKVTSIRVWYASGLEVEFGVTTPDWAALPVDEGTRHVVAGGIRVLIDRSGLLVDLRRALSLPP